MNHMFNTDSPIMRFLSHVFDLMFLNLLFILSCIPVVTIGASMSALYYVNMKIVRGEEPYIFKNFVNAFKANFKQSTILWILSVLIFLFLYTDFYILSLQTASFFDIIRVALWVISILLFSMFIYIFPIIARFVCTTKQAIKNAALMTFGFFPYSLLLLALHGLIFLLCKLSLQTLASVVVLSGLCGFSLFSLVASLIFNRVFKTYEPAVNPCEDENLTSNDTV